MTEAKDLYELYKILCRGADYWNELDGEERHGTVEEARHQVEKMLDGIVEWEAGVEESDNIDEWDHFHPRVASEEKARLEAMEMAKEDGFENPRVYMLEGPYFDSMDAEAFNRVME